MDIFGIGGAELIAVFVIMLIVAGPKRMIAWSYTLGKWLSQLQKIWRTTAEQIQKEFDAEGIDVRVPKDLPTRDSVRQEVTRLAHPFTKPLQDGMNEVQREIDEVKQIKREVNAPQPPASAANGTTAPKTSDGGEFGTWSGGSRGDG